MNKHAAINQSSLLYGKLSLDHRMPSTKIEAFLREFPAITRHIEKTEIRQVFVSRVTPEIINMELVQRAEDCGDILFGSVRNIPHEQIFLLDEEFNLVSRNYTQKGKTKKKHLFFGPNVTAPDVVVKVEGMVKYPNTIENKLVELEQVANKIVYMLSFCDLNGVVILYKSPKGISIPEWIAQQIEKEKEVLRAQVREIETEVI